MEKITKKDLFDRAWKCIKENFMDKTENNLIAKGVGLSLFIFDEPSDKKKSSNCKYSYLKQNTYQYSTILSDFPKERDGCFIIAINIPYAGDIIIDIKIFKLGTREEIPYNGENVDKEIKKFDGK